jgi:hypothetical protein
MTATRLLKPPRHGWSYSIAVGLLAGAIWQGMVYSSDLSRHWRELTAVILTGFGSARLGGWLGTATGGRDHGWRAGAYTTVLFVLSVLLVMRIASGHGGDFGDALQQSGFLTFLGSILGYMALSVLFTVGVAWPQILLAYFIGTLSFSAALKLVSRCRKHFGGIPASGPEGNRSDCD